MRPAVIAIVVLLVALALELAIAFGVPGTNRSWTTVTRPAVVATLVVAILGGILLERRGRD